MEYQVSEFEQEYINKIRSELTKFPNISEVEKAYYIYYRLCQFYVKNFDFYYGHEEQYIERQYTKQTEQDRRATCFQENATIAEAMLQMGLNAGYIKVPNIHHVDGYFITKSGNVYFFNAFADLTRAKTGRILRNFGLDYNSIKYERNYKYGESIANYLLSKGINVQTASSERIKENEIIKMNYLFGIEKYGAMLNDFFEVLKKAVNNTDYMRRKFGTSDKGKQAEKVIEILNIHKVPNDTEFDVDYSTGSEYYEYVLSVFPENVVKFFDGKEVRNTADKERKVFFVKQEGKLLAYEFNQTTQRLQKLNIKELARQNILNIYMYEGNESLMGEKRTIGYAINKMQKECEEPEH